jgi:hypothetical protein
MVQRHDYISDVSELVIDREQQTFRPIGLVSRAARFRFCVKNVRSARGRALGFATFSAPSLFVCHSSLIVLGYFKIKRPTAHVCPARVTVHADVI